MKVKSILFLLVTATFFVVSCNKDEAIPPQSTAIATGTITGKVMVKNGQKPVGGALVFTFNDKSEIYTTHTDANGNFSLKAPIGNRKLQIQTGGGANFRTTIPVTVAKNQSIAIEPALTRLDQVARMAYVVGSYDNIQDIVTSLGYTIEAITSNDLENYSIVSQYDIVFLNCGADRLGSNRPAVDINLANFVTNGGSIYASDWSVAYLTGGAYHSNQCGEAGGFIPDDKLCTKANGVASTITGAQISNSDLATALGFSTLDIVYDLVAWEKVESYDPTFWDVLVTDPATSKPLMIKTNHFCGGTVSEGVGVSGGDNWMTICHKISATESVTISIDASEWPEHQAHGDSIGDCTNSGNCGSIYFTTFHNHASGNIGNTIYILEYVILNL